MPNCWYKTFYVENTKSSLLLHKIKESYIVFLKKSILSLQHLHRFTMFLLTDNLVKILANKHNLDFNTHICLYFSLSLAETDGLVSAAAEVR